VKVLVKDILPMWKVREQKVEEVILTVDAETMVPEELRQLKALCENNRGHCKLYFDLKAPELTGPERLRSRSFVIEPTSEFMKGAQRLVGPENIRLTGSI
jgi:DNA polymerase-3 subunit alpha